jgi:hypothetical protein
MILSKIRDVPQKIKKPKEAPASESEKEISVLENSENTNPRTINGKDKTSGMIL